jgi:hypothetical protein
MRIGMSERGIHNVGVWNIEYEFSNRNSRQESRLAEQAFVRCAPQFGQGNQLA